MFSTLRTRFGIPGVISVIALVFAMLGGAYAASNSGDGKKASASAKAKKGPRGPKGATGPAGPQGPAGPAGANGQDGLNGLDGEDGEDGEDGDDGTDGGNGADGADGADGTSVANTAEAPGANCTEGGTKLVGTSTTYACNGLKGADGVDGETGFTETLPAGKTETGAWSFGTISEGAMPEVENPDPEQPPIPYPVYVPISFPIPLAAVQESTKTHFLQKGQSETADCPGTPADPKAVPGHLCIYTANESTRDFPPAGTFVPFGVFQAGSENQPGIGKSGSIIRLAVFAKNAFGYGTWAVTAPTS